MRGRALNSSFSSSSPSTSRLETFQYYVVGTSFQTFCSSLSIYFLFLLRQSISLYNVFSRVHATLYVTMSVGPSVGPSVITSRFWAFRANRRADFSYCPCPATILPLPTRTRLMLPCIRPWFLTGEIKWKRRRITRKVELWTSDYK